MEYFNIHHSFGKFQGLPIQSIYWLTEPLWFSKAPINRAVELGQFYRFLLLEIVCVLLPSCMKCDFKQWIPVKRDNHIIFVKLMNKVHIDKRHIFCCWSTFHDSFSEVKSQTEFFPRPRIFPALTTSVLSEFNIFQKCTEFRE